MEFSTPRFNPVLDAIRFTIDVGELGATQVLDVRLGRTRLQRANRLPSLRIGFEGVELLAHLFHPGRVAWTHAQVPWQEIA